MNRSKARKYLLNQMPKNGICAEIGVLRGLFSDRILNITKPQKLFLIDPWYYCETENHKYANWGGLAGNQNILNDMYLNILSRIDIHIKNGQVIVYRLISSMVVNLFEESYFDWIYIDGNHEYEYVKKDFDLYYPKVKSNGFICGDDFYEKDVEKALFELIEKNKNNVELIFNDGNQFILKKL